jgi:MarR family transcriptional regulator, organic hydroperoxide resistance regulator
MDVAQASTEVIRLYPRIYFACHRRHVRDPGSNRVLSSHQVSILDHLDERAVTFTSTLAEHMGVTVSTISLALDRLMRDGFVRRVPDKADRRRVGVLLTKAGVRIRDSRSVLDPELVAALVGRLDEEQRAQAVRGLKLLAGAGGASGTADAARQVVRESKEQTSKEEISAARPGKRTRETLPQGSRTPGTRKG